MFNPKTTSKTKNENITRSRMELSCFSFDVTYRQGKENVAVNTLSYVCSSATCKAELKKLNQTGMAHCLSGMCGQVKDKPLQGVTNVLRNEDTSRIIIIVCSSQGTQLPGSTFSLKLKLLRSVQIYEIWEVPRETKFCLHTFVCV